MVDEALISQKFNVIRQDLEYTINQLFIDTHRRSKKERWFCHDFIVVHTYTWSVPICGFSYSTDHSPV